MKNLSYIDIDYFDWYKKIVTAKRENELLLEQDFLDAVKKRYDEYISKFNRDDLIYIQDSIYSKNHKELSSCYKSKTNIVSKLLTEIKEAQTVEAKSKCQYCGINKPKTIDHYLPISLYPEFAVLAINLLPCCNECNKKKDNYWKEDGIRGILNFYVDNIPNEQFLVCEIIIKNNLPYVNFSFDFNLIDADLSKVIISHFKRLELFIRYQEESADEISEISRQLNIYSNGKSPNEICNLIKKDSLNLKDKYGKNYWKAVLREGLANSKDYINNYKKYIG